MGSDQRSRHCSCMTTQHEASIEPPQKTPPQDLPPDAGFDPVRLRSVAQMRRSRDDRMLAGVCGGLARYLNIDPVVVRVLVAALTVVGGAGFVLYVAAWLLVPEEGSDTSIVSERLPAGRGRFDARTIGFAIAGVLIVLAVASTGPWSGWSFPWTLLALAFIALLFLPSRRASADLVPTDPGADPAAGSSTALRGAPGDPTLPGAPAPPRLRRPSRGDGTLGWLTIGVSLIAAGILWLVDRSSDGVEWPDYVALELTVIGLGALVGTWRGAGRRLIPLGLLLGLVLLASAQLPALNAGDVRAAPLSAAELEPEYVLGAGELRLDLTGVADLAELDGRTISIENGMGQVQVIVPDEVDLTVDAQVDLGHLLVFTRDVGGWDSRVDWQDSDDADPDVRLVIDQSFGEIEVRHP